MALPYALRLDSEDVAKFIDWLDADGGSYLVVRETVSGENPHFHAILWSARKIQAVRVSFKRAYPELVGNKSYSIAEVRDVDKYHRYMCKGDSKELAPEVVGAYGMQYMDVLWQNEQHDEYWTENAVIAARAHAATSMVDFTTDACKNAGISWADKHAIAKVYIKEAVARNKSINIFAIRAQVNLISCLLCPDDSAIDDLANSVVSV